MEDRNGPPVKLYAALHRARAKMSTVAKSGHNKYDNYHWVVHARIIYDGQIAARFLCVASFTSQEAP